MSTPDYREQLAAPVRTLRLIVAAMTAGVVIFGVVIQFIPPQEQVAGDADKMPLVTYIAVAYALGSLVLGGALGVIVATACRRRLGRGQPQSQPAKCVGGMNAEFAQSDAGRLLVIYFVKTIISAAVFEGAAFFLLVAFLLERNMLSLGLVGVLVIVLAMLVPSRDRVERWLDVQQRQLEQERDAFGGRSTGA